MLVTSIFSFSNDVFYSIRCIILKSASTFDLDKAEILLSGKEFNHFFLLFCPQQFTAFPPLALTSDIIMHLLTPVTMGVLFQDHTRAVHQPRTVPILQHRTRVLFRSIPRNCPPSDLGLLPQGGLNKVH